MFSVKGIISHDHHRNGIGGEGFYVVEFKNHDEGCDPVVLTAIVPDPTMNFFHRFKNGRTKAASGWTTNVYVIDRRDPSMKWRGDRIAYELVPMLYELTKEDYS